MWSPHMFSSVLILALGVALLVGCGGENPPATKATARITITEGTTVARDTVLHLDGSTSSSTAGAITAYSWGVSMPPGGTGAFQPDDHSAQVTYQVSAAGTYKFALDVTDVENNHGTAEVTVTVTPLSERPLRIELTWVTPNDPDPNDEGPEAGSDVDLHFSHPQAATPGDPDVDGDGNPDPYFDTRWDCFWFNPTPDWGTPNPTLDRDDTNTAGPEILTMPLPAASRVYRIAVHYWRDHGYGASQATIRVFIDDVQIYHRDDVNLVNHDLWAVGDLTLPAGRMVASDALGGGPLIYPGYSHPDFVATAAAGKWGIATAGIATPLAR